jgi:hypothetical protein
MHGTENLKYNFTTLGLQITPLNVFVLKFWTLYSSDDDLADRPKLVT